MRGPFAALTQRLGRRRSSRTAAAPSGRTAPPRVPLTERSAPLTEEMARGAPDMQSRLEQARRRLKRDIAPRPDDDV